MKEKKKEWHESSEQMGTNKIWVLPNGEQIAKNSMQREWWSDPVLTHHIERELTSCDSKAKGTSLGTTPGGQQTFSVKAQVVNILGFSGQTVFVVTVWKQVEIIYKCKGEPVF